MDGATTALIVDPVVGCFVLIIVFWWPGVLSRGDQRRRAVEDGREHGATLDRSEVQLQICALSYAADCC